MACYGLYFVLIVLILQTCVVYVQGQITKSSLTFVIDYTLSMTEEIRSVKEEVNIIFDKVYSSKTSQIENFIIVTFNDPAAELRIITKDPAQFKQALASIRLHSDYNYDCPEKAMTGIEIALTESLPGSFLYVFTDASASDYHKYEHVKTLAQKKQSQVVFLLTGECGSTTNPEYQVYRQMAHATGGQIFRMMKDDVKDILKYIEESITGKGFPFHNQVYPPGTHKIKFNVDAHTGDVLISLTGLGSRIGEVTGPGGSKPPMVSIVSGKDKMAVKRLSNLKPGDYELEIEGKGEVHIIMIAKSDIDFQVGFSVDSPSSIKDTVTRPPPDGNAFLGIKLVGKDVELTSVKIFDLNKNVIAELPLTLVDKKEQFYITPSFSPPSNIFLVNLIGKDSKTGTPVIRTNPSPIARQNPSAEPAVNTAPEITIQGASKIIAEYDAPLKLKCRVHGYPKPEIIWSEKDTGIPLTAKVQRVDTYDYDSVLEINKANKNVSYEIKASNAFGTTIQYIEVETERKTYFDVIEAPKDIVIEYDKEGSIVCKIDAYPPATITWYKDGTPFSGNTDIDVSGDKSMLTIKHMQPESKGKYTCEATSDLDRKVFDVDVAISGVEAPVIDKASTEQSVTETTNAVLSCRIVKGIPKPAIRWSFKRAGTTAFSAMMESTETVHLNNVLKEQTGTYKCSAENALGSDSFTMEIIVEYPPKIKEVDKVKQIKTGEKVRIPCDVTGEPVPTVTWFFKGTKLDSSAKIVLSGDHSIEFAATPSDAGDYICEATNKLDTAKITVSIDVLEAPVIDKSLNVKRVTEKTNAVLSCNILRGNPKPIITWSFKRTGTASFSAMTETTETVQLDNVRKEQTGTYKCSAKNALESDSFTMEIIVEYPPDIKEDDKVKQVKNGDKVRIPCDVTGEPSPTVTWFFKGTRLDSSAKFDISGDHSITFEVTPSDAGDYTCEAENKIASTKKTVALDVLEAPVIDKSPKPKRVIEKTNAALSCNILRGNPKPIISWSFKRTGTASFSAMTETTETVHLNNVLKEQTGTYKCSAQNALGSDSFTMELVVEYPAEIKADDKVKQIKTGDKVRIPCDVTGEPAPKVTWFFKGTKLAGSAKFVISGDHSITFEVTPSDAGDYTCEAANKLVTTKKTVSLDVLEAPVIDKSLKQKRVTEKTDAVIFCNILRGNPKPVISWSFKRAGTATFSAMTETTETVHLNNVLKKQTGIYKCSAQNSLGSDSFSIELVVEYPAEIKADDKVKQIKTGDKVRIPCDVTGEPAPTVTWFFKGTKLASSAKFVISADHSISFEATPSDAGDYKCEAANKLVTTTKTVSLDVLEAPVIDKSPKQKRVTEKTDAVIFCNILRGNPKPVISWSFKRAGTATFSAMTEATDTVHLNNVLKEQTGTYKCSAQNSLGSDSFTMELVVEYPAEIKEGDKVKQVNNGEKVRIPCDVTGEPAPTVTWFFKGIRLDSSAKFVISGDHSITFAVTPSDVGDYTCEAKNTLNMAKKTVSLDVLEAPVVDKSPDDKSVEQKTNVVLSCRILRGNPKPIISWSFKRAGISTFSAMTETTETVHLNNVLKEQTGTYKCSAQNSLGSDSFTMELVVEYPPIIKKDVPLLQIKENDEVRISCDVTGEPAPAVTWFFNDTRHDSTAMGRESSDHSLRFKVMLADIGFYRCEAKNKLGDEKKTTELQVYVPVTIEIPKNSNIQKMVGQNQILDCLADGYPEPTITWTFQSPDPKIPAKDITPAGAKASVTLVHLQLDQHGLYTCTAENGIGGSDSITYDVKVYAPPAIVNTYPSKVFEAVTGDVALRIQCKATGIPKPSITWTKDSLTIVMGSARYDMDDDGTLIIKNIDRTSEGAYVCHVNNVLGEVTQLYEVNVKDNAEPGTPTDTIYVKEGDTVKVDCSLPHSSKDQMKWYKDRSVIASGELTLYSVTRSDDGKYTCRVSNPTKSRSVTTKVVVQFKPQFSTTEPDTVEFVHGADAKILSCEAYGEPQPTTATWKHNGNPLTYTDMSYAVGMDYGKTGTYECEVSNVFGSIRRTFKVTSRDCILDINKDFPKKQPIMYTHSLTWPVFPVKEGYMIIPHEEYFYMNCPPQFSNPTLPAYNVMAFCERDDTVKINGNLYKFVDIQCTKEVESQESKIGIPCLPTGKTEYVKIGYQLKSVSKFLEVFDVCLDTENNVPLFTKHTLSPYHTDRSTETAWSSSLLPQDFDTLYDCSRQMYDITSALGRGLSTPGCCFGKRQLVNSHNLLSGIPPSSAYSYLNVIPHWSTCNSMNWENVEQSVRKLVKSSKHDLIITTGTATLRHGGASTDITLHDGRGGKQAVAPYLWKVVQDPHKEAYLAIIQINIPELTETEASKHVLCPDISCSFVSWLEPSDWTSVEDGYTYCCSITDFEKAFGYNGLISSGRTFVLID